MMLRKGRLSPFTIRWGVKGFDEHILCIIRGLYFRDVDTVRGSLVKGVSVLLNLGFYVH